MSRVVFVLLGICYIYIYNMIIKNKIKKKVAMYCKICSRIIYHLITQYISTKVLHYIDIKN